jgi:hypothetical protein
MEVVNCNGSHGFCSTLVPREARANMECRKPIPSSIIVGVHIVQPAIVFELKSSIVFYIFPRATQDDVTLNVLNTLLPQVETHVLVCG